MEVVFCSFLAFFNAFDFFFPATRLLPNSPFETSALAYTQIQPSPQSPNVPSQSSFQPNNPKMSDFTACAHTVDELCFPGNANPCLPGRQVPIGVPRLAQLSSTQYLASPQIYIECPLLLC
jgi:hypothetical protein